MKFLNLLTIFFLVSCSTAKLDQTKEIKINTSIMDDTYYQNDKRINTNEMIDYLKDNSKTSKLVKNRTSMVLRGIGLAAVGGSFTGKALANQKTSDYIIGLSSIFTAFYIINVAEDNVNEAVRVHNKSLNKASFSPVFNGDSFAGFFNFSF